MPAVLRPLKKRMSVSQTVAARTRIIMSPGSSEGSLTLSKSSLFDAFRSSMK